MVVTCKSCGVINNLDFEMSGGKSALSDMLSGDLEIKENSIIRYHEELCKNCGLILRIPYLEEDIDGEEY